MEFEQPPPENLTDDQKNFWSKKQAEANAAKRAIQELATQSISKRRCTTKTPQGPSQSSQVRKSAPSDIKTLIAQADSAAALAKEAESHAFREEVV